MGAVGSFFGFALTAIANVVLSDVILFFVNVVIVFKVISSSSARAMIGGGSMVVLSLGNVLMRHARRDLRGMLSVLAKSGSGICNLSSVLTSVGGTGRGRGVGKVCVRTSTLNSPCTSLRTVHGTLASFGRDKGFVMTCDSKCARKLCCLSDMTSGMVLGPGNVVR